MIVEYSMLNDKIKIIVGPSLNIDTLHLYSAKFFLDVNEKLINSLNLDHSKLIMSGNLFDDSSLHDTLKEASQIAEIIHKAINNNTIAEVFVKYFYKKWD